MTIDHVTHAAKAVERAVEGLNGAADVLQAAQDEVARIHARIAPHDQARDAILARHQQGDGRSNDPGELTLIQADKDGLTKMLPIAEAAVASAQSAHEQATATLAQAREAFTQANLRMEFAAVWEQAEEHVTKAALSLAAALGLAPKLKDRAGIADVSAALATLEQAMLTALRVGPLVSPGWAPTGYVPHVPSETFLGVMRRHQQNQGRFHP